jgi:hypothetical protein
VATAISFKPKATRKRLQKEILSGDFKKRKIFWKNIAEHFPPHITTYWFTPQQRTSRTKIWKNGNELRALVKIWNQGLSRQVSVA